MKRLSLLIMPLMAVSFLMSCGGGGGGSETKEYTAKWLDYNGNVLKEEKCKEGTVPVYEDATHGTPTRESDAFHDYTFAAWAPTPTEIHSDQAYVATYDELSFDTQAYIKVNITNKTFRFNYFTLYELPKIVIDWGDGKSSTGTGGVVDHTYDDNGSYNIRIYGCVTSISAPTAYRGTIEKVYFGRTITSIDSQAFYQCKNLKSVTFASNSTLNSINWFAFSECTNLTSITIPSSVTVIEDQAFYQCKNLKSVTFASNPTLTSIGKQAFSECTNLTSITIPSSVTSIDKQVFERCTNLSSVTFENNSTLNSIADCAFGECTNLTSITIPSSVTSIDMHAFHSCANLTEIKVDTNNQYYTSQDASGNECNAIITKQDTPDETPAGTLIIGCSKTTIPNGVLSIANGVFDNCINLIELNIPNSVTLIGNHAFNKCTNLQSLTFESNSKLNSIGYYAFSECTNLTSITIPNSVTLIGNYAFNKCTNLQSLTFEHKSKLNSIGDYVFSECTNLTSINIPSSVTSIGYYAFSKCTNLKSVTFENNSALKSIEYYAFSECTNLTSITIPNSVTLIRADIFYSCINLVDIKVEASNQYYTSQDASGNECNAIITKQDTPDETPAGTLIIGCSKTTIPNNVISIGEDAFYYCLNLTSINIPSSVISIAEDGICGYCSNLAEIKVDINNQYFTSRNENGGECNAIITKQETPDGIPAGTLIDACNKTVIPNTVASLATYAFYGRSSIFSIAIPNSVTSIGDKTFYGCLSLAKVDLTAYTSVDAVPSYINSAFEGCSSELKFHVASDEMKGKFMEQGWPESQIVIGK